MCRPRLQHRPADQHDRCYLERAVVQQPRCQWVTVNKVRATLLLLLVEK